MAQPPLDTLKIRAYGVKNPAAMKEARQEQHQDQKRYYPKDKAGNYDEWAAVLAN